MIRRLSILLLVALLALSLPGCWSRVEVNDLAIVSMMAIDRTEEGSLQVWLQVVVPANAGGASAVPSGGKGEAPFVTITGTGQTVLEAARHIQMRLSRRIFWAHARVILIGERLARAGVRPAMDFLLRHRELRLDNYILMVKGDVGAVMGARLDLEKQPVEALRQVLRYQVGTVVTLADWVQQREAAGADPLMAVTELVKPPKGAPKGQKPQLQVAGTALFRGDRLVGVLDSQVTRGLLCLRGKVDLGGVTLALPRAPGGEISLEYVDTRIYRRVGVENGKLVVRLLINSEGTISDEQVNLDLDEPGIIREIEAQMRTEIQGRIDAALRQMRNLQVDPAGLGELVRQHRPAVWRRLAKSWREEALQTVEIRVQVRAQVRRTGLSGPPRGIRENELIKGDR